MHALSIRFGYPLFLVQITVMTSIFSNCIEGIVPRDRKSLGGVDMTNLSVGKLDKIIF